MTLLWLLYHNFQKMKSRCGLPHGKSRLLLGNKNSLVLPTSTWIKSCRGGSLCPPVFVPPGTPNSSRQLVRAFSFISRYQLWQNPAGGGGILRIQAPFCLLRRHSPVRGITPPLRIEKPFGRAEKKKSLQPTCPYLQCGSPHRVLNLSITLKVPKSGL